jgi:hypothetical protein
MNDCELLEKAAKAAGYKETRQFSDTCFQVRRPDTLWDDWNPLTDDGDALRLAVKLRIKFRYNEALGQALAWTGGVNDCEARADIEKCGRDEYACARLAIVRAAAAIGEKK